MTKTSTGFVSKDELLKRRPVGAESRQRIDAIKEDVLLEHSLSELRELAGVTQTTIAERMETSRPNVYRIERETDVRLSTLRRYVDAIGGSLRIEATLPDGNQVTIIADKDQPGAEPRTDVHPGEEAGAPRRRGK